MAMPPLIDMIFLLLLFFLLGSDFLGRWAKPAAPPRGSGRESSAAPPRADHPAMAARSASSSALPPPMPPIEPRNRAFGGAE